MQNDGIRRRQFLKALPAAAMAARTMPGFAQAASKPAAGRFKQGITRQMFGQRIMMEDCCRQAAEIGFKGFDFADNPSDWPLLKKYGLTQSMYRVDAPQSTAPAGAGGGRAAKPPGWDMIGWKEAQGDFLKACHAGVDTCAANGFPNFLLLVGPRGTSGTTVSLEQGMDNAVAFCNDLKARAEDKGVTLCVEFINSKNNQYKSSLFDHMVWGVELIQRVNSPRVKILYDIWQAQQMDGDIIQTIRDNIAHIGHFHTGGVPGRHQIDETQELNYHVIAQAIADVGYTGYVSHEWSPSAESDPVATARKAFAIMNV